MYATYMLSLCFIVIVILCFHFLDLFYILVFLSEFIFVFLYSQCFLWDIFLYIPKMPLYCTFWHIFYTHTLLF